MENRSYLKEKFTVKKMSMIAIFAAISSVLYFLKFPLPIFPSFLEINFSMLPVIICALVLGPTEGFIVVLIRFLVKLMSSHTAGVGEIADLIIGGIVAIAIGLSATFIKTENKNKKAIISLLIGILAWVIAGVLSNWLISIPLYIELYFHGNVNILIDLLDVIPGEVNESNYMAKYLFFAVVPFNLIISLSVSIVTFLVYKKLSEFIEK